MAMIGNPGAIVFEHDGRNQIYTFVTGNGGGLQDRFWNAAPGMWEWDDRGNVPGVALVTSPSPATSRRDANAPEGSLHIFAGGEDNALYERYWDGTAWIDWINHGSPHFNNPVENKPAATGFLANTGGDDPLFFYDVLVFIWSQDALFRYSRHFDSWAAQPNVPQAVASEPSVIVQYLGANTYTPLCYMVGRDQNLYVHYATDGTAREWASHNLGRPGPGVGVALLNRPGLGLLGQFRALVIGEDSNLWAHSWGGKNDGTRGSWSVLGRPADGAAIVGEISPVVFNFGGVDFIYNFFRGDTGKLYEAQWDGQDSVIWDNFGQPTTGGVNVPASPDGGNTAIVSAPSAISFNDQIAGITKMYAFVKGNDNHLHVCFWDGNMWKWNDLGPDPQD